MKFLRVIIGLSFLGILFLNSGCAFNGKTWMVGMGSIENEWYEDGKLKRSKIESKTPFQDVIGINGIKN